MRGKELFPVVSVRRDRITPAYAGKSTDLIFTVRQNQDHPRLCGEKLETGVHGKPTVGSPPPMRGKGIADSLFRFHDRITPAYAGKSAVSKLKASRNRDHPRLCGEKIGSR